MQMWIHDLKESTDSALLYADNELLSRKDIKEFNMALMTCTQREMLLHYGTKAVCVDTTHGTNSYGLLLMTVLVIAADWSGIPCAYLLSQSTSEETMVRFFQAIKDSIGQALCCEAFMSDDAAAYCNAWQKVMGIPQRRLLCTWHIRRSWTSKLSKVSGDENKKLVRHSAHFDGLPKRTRISGSSKISGG